MYRTELGAAACFAVVDEGLSHREAARRYGIDRWTVADALLNGEIFCSFKEASPSPNLGGVTATPSVHTAAWVTGRRPGNDHANPARLRRAASLVEKSSMH